ncbi:MAG: nucleotidyltransferase domain-containing protein [Candidatus Hydrogenedentota bacterium]
MATNTASIAASPIAQGVKRIVREFDPEAEVILYGSRARGDAEPDSDWDFLVLVKHTLSFDEERALSRRIYDLELQSDQVFSSIIRTKSEWQGPLSKAMPFHKNVEREGIAVP